MYCFRYLFKKALLEDEIARSEALAKREQIEIIHEEDVQWEKGKNIDKVDIDKLQKLY